MLVEEINIIGVLFVFKVLANFSIINPLPSKETIIATWLSSLVDAVKVDDILLLEH